MKFVNKALILLTLLSDVMYQVTSHGVEVRYCQTNDGKLRILIEHWHGTTAASGAGTMTINDASGTTVTLTPNGAIYGQTSETVGNAADCAGGTTLLSSTCNREENNWVYYDFPNDCSAASPPQYTLLSGNTQVLETGCGTTLYPTTISLAQACAAVTNAPSLSLAPSKAPSVTPSVSPSAFPSAQPSSLPSSLPSVVPSDAPSNIPSVSPSSIPSLLPSPGPSSRPSSEPSSSPTLRDPCKFNNCNGHGKCTTLTNFRPYVAKCICENTFVNTPSGDGCRCPEGHVLDSNSNRCYDLCAGNDCNGHGTCNSATGQCSCDDSFIASDSGSCTCPQGYSVDPSTNTCVESIIAPDDDFIGEPVTPDDDSLTPEDPICMDNPEFTYFRKDKTGFAHCEWISRNNDRLHIRRYRYCFTDANCEVPSDIGKECPYSCGFCDGTNTDTCPDMQQENPNCKDQYGFQFPMLLHPEKLRTCDWLFVNRNSKKTLARREKYCANPEIAAACPKSCALCEA
ncbi:hypothetical protein CTEN210_10065 [Chaetoceros tenuissimus]|uniref:Epidermal growth factor-like domain-containing protein n=1 Tax=Chaetoceros tenuissimus TaxID=426638 RepID=A0AAD3CXA5_9STRA|nr:hypothetical protein CTEN210_10065 [Chaetoceros tenuissimus]